MSSSQSSFGAGRLVAAGAVGAVAIAALLSLGSLAEQVGADDITVIQSPVAGDLTWYTTQGLKWQGFGGVTTYKKRAKYEFGSKAVECSVKAGGIEVRFNDGGHGVICGSIQYDLPVDTSKLTALYSKFHSQDVIQRDIIETVTNNAIYMVGPLMSSKESYAEKRNDLIHYVLDQVQNGVYRTYQHSVTTKDPLTNQEKTVTVADIVIGQDGQPERQQESLLHKYGIIASNFAIEKLPYQKEIENQITQQQQITMDVQTSIAELKKAEQRALTVEQQGRANAAEAKWKQETEKARAVTLAEQEKQVFETNATRDKNVQVIAANRDKEVAETQAKQRLAVAEFDRKSAEQTKQQQILLGEGESKRKELVLAADGALQQKLDAYIKVSEFYANAIKGSNWVPLVNSAAASGDAKTASGGNVNDLISLFTAKAAKELSLDMNVMPGPGTGGVKR